MAHNTKLKQPTGLITARAIGLKSKAVVVTQNLYLHIGAAKTGTSAIQTHMVRHSETALKAGLYYPGSDTDTLANVGRPSGGNGASLARYLLDQHSSDQEIYDRLCSVMEGYNLMGRDKALISCQYLEQISPERVEMLQKVCANFAENTGIVYMVRDVADHAIAIYSDKVWREGDTRSFAEFIDDYHCPFEDVFTNFSSAFGPSAIHSLVYDDCRDNLIAELFHTVGIKGDNVALPEQINRSLSRLEIDLVRTLQIEGEDKAYIARLASEHAYRTRALDHERLEITSEELTRLEERFQPMITRINRTFLANGNARLNSCSDTLVISETRGGPSLDDNARLVVEMLKAAVSAHDSLVSKLRSV